jgi:hypothetical protein
VVRTDTNRNRTLGGYYSKTRCLRRMSKSEICENRLCRHFCLIPRRVQTQQRAHLPSALPRATGDDRFAAMQRTPQPTRAAATATTTRPIAAASIHAKTGAGGAIQIAPSQAKATTTALTQPRRALQPLDSNQRAALASIAKAPFAYVSRFSRPVASAPMPSVAKPVTPSVTGVKRKQQPVEDAKPTPTQSTEEVDETDESSMAASDLLEQQRRENVAWLDMLVALLERKYQRHAMPVDIEAIQDAKLLDAYWPQKTPPTATASSKRSRVAVRVDTPPSATSSLSSTSAGGGGAAVLSSQDDKEEKRTQALRRHAQQIHDTSVSSTSCCGCKTGCLKMYVSHTLRFMPAADANMSGYMSLLAPYAGTASALARAATATTAARAKTARTRARAPTCGSRS